MHMQLRVHILSELCRTDARPLSELRRRLMRRPRRENKQL